MIRPLTIKYHKEGGQFFDNRYSGKGYYYSVRDHRGNTHGALKKLPSEFCTVLLSHPITAFGYNFEGIGVKVSDTNIKFNKHEVIHALDFWIEHWVYQNQIEYTFTGTVNVDHEITLKELILIREKIMKMPADTMFTRSRIRTFEFSKGDRWEDSESVYGEDSTLDPFCYQVIVKTLKQAKKDVDNMSKGLTNIGQVITQIFTDSAQHAGEAMNEFARVMQERAMQATPVATGELIRNILADNPTVTPGGDWNTTNTSYNMNPDTWRSVPTNDGNDHNSWKVVDDHDRNVATHFRLNTEAQAFIDEHRISGVTTTTPAGIVTAETLDQLQNALNQPGSRVVVNGPITAVARPIALSEGVTMNGVANEPLRPGDLLIRDSEGRLRKADGSNPWEDENRAVVTDVNFSMVRDPVTGVMGIDPGPNNALVDLSDVSVNVTVNRNIARDSTGDMVHTGEPSVSGNITINGVEHQVSNVRIRMEPQHPDPSLPAFQMPERERFAVLSVPVEAQTITVTDTEEDDNITTYENMIVSVNPVQLGGTDMNSFVTVPVEFSGNDVTVSMEVIIDNGRRFDEMVNTLNSHTIRIIPGGDEHALNTHIEVDGHEYHVTNAHINWETRDPLRFIRGREGMRSLVWHTGSTYVYPRPFNNMRINKAEIDIDRTMEAKYRFACPETEKMLELTLLNPLKIFDFNDGWYNIELMGNGFVRINDEEYVCEMEVVEIMDPSN